MAMEAEAHAGEDKVQREAIESKNQLDTLIYSVEKVLGEHGDQISDVERGEVENALADAKSALQSNDKGTMEHSRERLTHMSHKLAEQMYRSAEAKKATVGSASSGAQKTPPPGSRSQSKRDEGIVDAEYVDVDEQKTA